MRSFLQSFREWMDFRRRSSVDMESIQEVVEHTFTQEYQRAQGTLADYARPEQLVMMYFTESSTYQGQAVRVGDHVSMTPNEASFAELSGIAMRVPQTTQTVPSRASGRVPRSGAEQIRREREYGRERQLLLQQRRIELEQMTQLEQERIDKEQEAASAAKLPLTGKRVLRVRK
jgi:hypothetical protein